MSATHSKGGESHPCERGYVGAYTVSIECRTASPPQFTCSFVLHSLVLHHSWHFFSSCFVSTRHSPAKYLYLVQRVFAFYTLRSGILLLIWASRDHQHACGGTPRVKRKRAGERDWLVVLTKSYAKIWLRPLGERENCGQSSPPKRARRRRPFRERGLPATAPRYCTTLADSFKVSDR